MEINVDILLVSRLIMGMMEGKQHKGFPGIANIRPTRCQDLQAEFSLAL